MNREVAPQPGGSWDIAIIGAGPAGALTALLAARSRPGLRIALVDQADRPHSRACGEFLAPGGMSVLADNGLTPVARARPVHGLRLVAGHAQVRLDFDADGVHGIAIRREDLDLALQAAAVAAGVVLIPGTRFVGCQRLNRIWRIATTGGVMQAAILIGADGRLSRVRQATGLAQPCHAWRAAVMARVSGLEPHRDGEVGEMHLGPLGQIGVAPLSGREMTLNLLLAPAARRVLIHRNPSAVLRAALACTPTLAERIRSLQITGKVLATGRLPHRACRVADANLALVGDAAGFWDPFTGDGISLALLQAQALAPCLARWDSTRDAPCDLAPYQRAWAQMTRIKRTGVLPWVLARRGFAELGVRMLARVPCLTPVLAHCSLPSPPGHGIR